ncbi:helix-turn-helix domain-containing protein [Nocardia sp. NPDC057455]|uniref:helix-turn-helix domain-containing protein n=1 Tax=Nocardia sp. NPDC057455 TaxID=3346138 RepID=UPI00366D2459
MSRNSLPSSPSLPAKTPPGRSTRKASANNASCLPGVGTWCSMVKRIPIGARVPTDPRARQVADALAADPADPRTLAEFAVHVAASPRTLARLFVSQTGLGFGQWRTQARLAASLPLLAAGLPVARIAGRVGYGTPSAYVAAFRRAVGIPPGRYFSG